MQTILENTKQMRQVCLRIMDQEDPGSEKYEKARTIFAQICNDASRAHKLDRQGYNTFFRRSKPKAFVIPQRSPFEVSLQFLNPIQYLP